MQKMDLGGEKLKPISYRAEMKMDLAAERAYMYDNMCREEQKRFYEVNMHGVDWKAMTANYRRFLPHINNKYDYAEMLSELLGELNVSHTVAVIVREQKKQLPAWDCFMIGIIPGKA